MVSFAVDIFSFGVVLLEICQGGPAPTNRLYQYPKYVLLGVIAVLVTVTIINMFHHDTNKQAHE